MASTITRARSEREASTDSKSGEEKTQKQRSIHIYSPYWHNFGGGERYMLHLAAAISALPGTKVTLLSDFPEIKKEKLQEFFRLDLSGIDYRAMKHVVRVFAQEVSHADVFIALSNFKRINATPSHYIQALQVPYSTITTSSISRKIISGKVKEALKDILRRQLLLKSQAKSTLTLTNSQFVHDTLLNNFGLESTVLHPPINDFLENAPPKRKTILSVGRFFSGLYNDKRYDILTAAFRSMSNRLEGWEYHIVGSASGDTKTLKLVQNLKERNAGFPVFFHVNEPHESLAHLYNEATILWHGAGFGVDEIREPERTEHFGMSVAEGLSARCIPIVVNKGGLKEIISHGKNGFVWETVNELTDWTLRVARMSEDDLKEIRENARERYSDFSVPRFNKKVSDIFHPLLS